MINELPNDALAAVFSYLNAAESIACRGVCQQWSKAAGQGAIALTVCNPPNSKTSGVIRPNKIGRLTVSGRLQITEDEENQAANAAPSVHEGLMLRTRGHLPAPAASSLTQDMNNSNAAQITFTTDYLRDFDQIGGGEKYRTDALNAGNILSLTNDRRWSFTAAIQVENFLSSHLINLDLGSSCSCFEYGHRCAMESIVYDRISNSKKPRTLRSALKVLDLTGLQHLKYLSVRGCIKMQCLNLPSTLCSLDTGSCSELLCIDFLNGAIGSLVNLDLSGCRMLKSQGCRVLHPRPGLLGPNTVEALRNLDHLDMSQVSSSGALDDTLYSALRSTVSLETVSFRYSANDEVLKALAESESASSGTLRQADIAFSTKATDEAVELLARNATNLERLNMRGCKGISASCYNHIPVYLARRHQREEDGSVLEEDESFRSCSRKGDNLFYFCGKK